MENFKTKLCYVANTDMAVKFLLLNHLNFLKTQGYKVYAVCSRGSLIKDVEKQGIRVKIINFNRGINPLAHLITLFRLFFYFKKEKFDIIHTHTPVPGLLAQLAAKMVGTPIIINTIHGFYFSDNSSFFKRKLFILMEKIAAKCSDLIFSQSKEDIKTAIKEKICNSQKIKYLGNGIDIQRFNSKRFSKEFIDEKKKKLGLAPDLKIIGVIGRLVEEKGYLELFEAFKKILKRFPKTLLLIIGPEEPKKKDKIDKNIIKDQGIEKSVLFLGQRTDIDELYPLFDIFILPSHREGFPRTVIEAQAAAKPVIATNIRGCREIIENGKTGILVPVKSPEKIAEAIIYLFENPEKAKEIGEEAEEKAKREFDERLIFTRIKTEYQRLIKEKLKVNKIKTCHVTTVDITVRFIILNFLRFLQKENYKISIVCSSGKWSSFFEEQSFSIHNIKMTRKITPLRDLISLIKLFLYFRKEKFAIVHTYTPKAGILGRIAARMAGTPIVIHASHGFYIGLRVSPWKGKLILFAEKIASYFCDLVFSQNKEDIELAVQKKIVNPEKIKLLTDGVDITLFNPLNFNQDFIYRKKKELRIEKNKKIIGMVGRFVKEKGYLDLFEAFKTIKSKNPDALLLLVAPLDKEKKDALDSSILKNYGIEKEVILLGYEKEISNIEEVYPLMDIFILPSYREGFPHSIMEASAAGKPIVATNIRGCREAVENNKTGILVPPKNPEKLAEVIIYFLENPEKAKEIGRNGRKKAEKEFDERVIFSKIKTEYQRLIKEKLK